MEEKMPNTNVENNVEKKNSTETSTPKKVVKKEINTFKSLYDIDVSSHLEDKNGLSYLSWSWAWAELCKVYPDAEYEIVHFPSKENPNVMVPFKDLGSLGCLVYTRITVNDVTKEMSLPVMDAANKPMMTEEYKYTVLDRKTNTHVERKVAAYNIMDINKTCWRCFVKNIAMFGLGLKVYSGDDLPPEIDPVTGEVLAPKYRALKKSGKNSTDSTPALASKAQLDYIKKLYSETEINAILKKYKIDKFENLNKSQATKLIEHRTKKVKEKNEENS